MENYIPSESALHHSTLSSTFVEQANLPVANRKLFASYELIGRQAEDARSGRGINDYVFRVSQSITESKPS
jgi:hypothetical protein